MRKLCLITAALGSISSPSYAFSSRASIELVAVIPVSCSLDTLGGFIQGRKLTLNVRRACNTGHLLAFAAATSEHAVTVSYNGQRLNLENGNAVLPQAERYYDRIDQLVVEIDGADDSKLLEYAASIHIELNTA